MLKQVLLARFEPVFTEFSPFHHMYAPLCALRTYLRAVWWSHLARAGGRNCQTRSPWAGRKGAVGRRHAGRACADNDRRGGGGGGRGVGGGARVEEGGATCGSHLGALPRLAGGELLVLCEAAVVGVEGGAVTLGWGRHARVHGHSAPCPNIPPRWPFVVCGRGVAGGAGPCF